MSEHLDVYVGGGTVRHRTWTNPLGRLTLCGRPVGDRITETYDPSWWDKQPLCRRCEYAELRTLGAAIADMRA